ncbi:MAG: hypothetical protein ACYTXP_39915 [Nostoc sp.]
MGKSQAIGCHRQSLGTDRSRAHWSYARINQQSITISDDDLPALCKRSLTGDAATPPSSATQLPVQATTPNNRAGNLETRQAVKNMQAVISIQNVI